MPAENYLLYIEDKYEKTQQIQEVQMHGILNTGIQYCALSSSLYEQVTIHTTYVH
jgi:hypothetical protein